MDAAGDGELFNRGLRQDVTLPAAESSIFAVPNTIMVDYQEGGDILTAITLLNGVTIKSGYLGNPGSINSIAVGGTIPVTAYGVYSDGVTRAVSSHIFYEGPCNWASSNFSVMSIDQDWMDLTLGVATARSAGQTYISANCGGLEFSPGVVTVQ